MLINSSGTQTCPDLSPSDPKVTSMDTELSPEHLIYKPSIMTAPASSFSETRPRPPSRSRRCHSNNSRLIKQSHQSPSHPIPHVGVDSSLTQTLAAGLTTGTASHVRLLWVNPLVRHRHRLPVSRDKFWNTFSDHRSSTGLDLFNLADMLGLLKIQCWDFD